MPKVPINYNKNMNYKIYCSNNSIEDVYVGHTTDFIRRMNYHKKSCNLKKDNYLYNFINDNGGWENWKMEIIELFPCSNSIESQDREKYWINNLEATLNTHIKYSNVEYKKEWYFKNQERIRLQQAKLRNQKKEQK